ncbi:hypothetical protein ACFOGJ_22715 [Marinibaculum pumilum]|uniref:Uncharacterized protein n=1 Tax=Marinibaculum pumilum TaxID=1766165 RepID=A0ABV7L5Y7_9PROT
MAQHSDAPGARDPRRARDRQTDREILADRQDGTVARDHARAVFMPASLLPASLLPASLLLAGLLAACNPLPYGKLVTDDIDKGFSVVTEEECDLQNVFKWESYCKERIVIRDRQPVYCYATLGRPNCYAMPDPYNVAGRGRGSPPPMALGDAVPAAVQAGPDLSVQYVGGEAFPGYQEEVVEVASDRPVSALDAPVPQASPQIPVQTQELPPKSTLRVPPEPAAQN